MIKALPGADWRPKLKAWSIPYSDEVTSNLLSLFKGKAWVDYSGKSLENVMNQSVAKANIKQKPKLHWLRLSYATHLLESGTDFCYIQELLRHSSAKTTEIYTQASLQKNRSPFNDL